jgi:hypothetical protein
MLTAECFFVQPRRADALAGLRIASPLHDKKETPGAAPGVEVVCVSVLGKGAALQGRNLHARGHRHLRRTDNMP